MVQSSARIMESNQELHNEMSEEIAHLLSSSISYQDSYLSQNGVVTSNMWGSSINVSHSVLQIPHQDAQFVRGESSRASMEESSLNADANSPFSGVSYLTGNSSNSIDSPASNCRRIPVPLSRDHFPAPPKTIQTGQIYPRWYGRQGIQLSSPTFSSPMMIPAHQESASVPSVINQKNPRLEITQEDLLRPSSLQKPSPNQPPMQLRSYDRVAASRQYQQNLGRNQQQNQTPVSVPSPLEHQMQYLSPSEIPEDVQRKRAAATALNGSICARRLMYFLHQQRRRPADNNFEFWRKLVEEYFSPLVKKRWCLSMYNKGCQDNWKCDLCGSKSGKGFEATYEILPRLSQIYFDSNSGVIDELLYIDSPVEKRMPSGGMMLWFNKAVQQGIYKNFRIVHEGQLRILFTRDLKILSWEFCIQRHEELVSRSLVAAQVNQFVEEAAKCQSNNVDIETEAGQAQEVATCNRLLVAGKNLATKVELSVVNDAGFSKQFVRHLQMTQVLECMKGLISICADSQTNNFSPIEALKKYRKEADNAKLRKHMENRAQRQQTPSADGNIQMSGDLIQTSNASEQAMPILSDYHQNKFLEGHRVPHSYKSSYNERLSHNASYQRSISSVKSLSTPSSFLRTPPVDRQINDLLAQLRAEGTPGIFSKNARSKRKLMYDPKTDFQVTEFADRTEVSTTEIEANTLMMGGMVDKGKGFNSSSSSNSSARVFADNCVNKREPVSDDDSTSAGNRQQEK